MTIQDSQTTDDGATGPARRIPNPSRRRCMIVALAIVSLLPLYWTLHIARLRLVQPNPQSPWESAILVDAWRAHHGLPVYTMPEVDHATHMYGPLITYVTAPFMRSREFSLRIPRYIALLSSFTLAGIVALRLTRGKGVLMLSIAGTLMLTQFYRTRATVAESRPDAAAAAFAALAVWLFYLAHRPSTSATVEGEAVAEPHL